MDSNNIIGWMIAACVLYMCFAVFLKPLKHIARLFFNGLLGVCGIFIMDFLLSPLNLAVGINVFTALTTALLGFPGFVALYGITWFLNI